VCFEDLGVGNITEEQIMAVANNCCEEGSLMYHEPYSFNPQIIAEAMKKAGCCWKGKKADEGKIGAISIFEILS
jgi:glycerol dehydrogenase-like iron-containing ADH family enzyme